MVSSARLHALVDQLLQLARGTVGRALAVQPQADAVHFILEHAEAKARPVRFLRHEQALIVDAKFHAFDFGLFSGPVASGSASRNSVRSRHELSTQTPRESGAILGGKLAPWVTRTRLCSVYAVEPRQLDVALS